MDIQTKIGPPRKRMRKMQPIKPDEQILLEKIPVLVWLEVFTYLGSESHVLENCSEVCGFFCNMIELNPSVLLLPKALPCVIATRLSNITLDNCMTDQSLKKLVNLNLCFRTIIISVNDRMRPSNETLNLLISSHSDCLEALHVSCLEASEPLILDFPKMKRLRVLKFLSKDTDSTPLILQPVFEVFPELESLTLSVGGFRQWAGLLPWVGFGGTLPDSKLCRNIKTFNIEDVPYTRGICVFMLSDGLLLLPNLVSVEIPAREEFNWIFRKMNKFLKSLRELTLTKDTGSKEDSVSLDEFVTGYSLPVCKEILANPDSDPEEIRKMIEGATPEHPAHHSISILRDLQVLRIKCETDWAPTVVSYPHLLRLKSLRVLHFHGGRPKHFPDDILQKMRKRFMILCE